MAENHDVNVGYGYASDEVKVSPFSFGANFGKCFLVKLEWIPNGGADGAEGEALEIKFKINDVEKGYRMFPVKQGFDKNNNAVTDPNAKEFKDAQLDFNSRVTHIMHCFISKETLMTALARPIPSFKEFCNIVQRLLPQGYETKALDIFLQYQWQPSKNQKRTFLEIPKKMSYGKFLCPAQPGKWKEQRAENIDDNTRKAMWYVNEEGQEHLFIRNGWFMGSHFANQRTDGIDGVDDTGQSSNVGEAPSAATEAAPMNAPSTTPAAW